MISSVVISVLNGRLPEMKTTDPYSPSARAKASVKPVTSAGSTPGSDDAEEGLAAARAEAGRRLLDLELEILQHRLHRPHDERQADERQRQRRRRAA